LILTQAIENSKTTIDVGSLQAGMYIVNLRGAEGVGTKKLVIAK
jgi:hypothetical protein